MCRMCLFPIGKKYSIYRRHTFCPRAERTTTHNQSIDQYIDRSKVLVIMSSAFSISLGAPGRLNTTKLSSKTLTRQRQFCISKKKRSASVAVTPVFAKVGEQLPPSTMVERQLPTTTDGDIGIYGAIAPFKNGFDPLGLSKRKTFDDLKRYREAELTHGRVCMLAAVGILVGEYVEGSSFLFDASITGPAINHFQQVPPPFWYALGVVIFIGEATRVQKGWADPFTSDLFTLRDDYVPGEIGFDPLGLCPDASDELYLDYKLKELSHGRLAMVATAFFVAKELVTGNKIFPQFDLFPYQ